MTYALYDIGGTKTRVAISRDGVNFEEPQIFNTPKDYRDGIKKIADISLDELNQLLNLAKEKNPSKEK